MSKVGMIGAALAVLGLAACEEFTVVDTPTSRYLALQDETRALRSSIDGLPVTRAIDIPLSGTARYDGTALIALDTPVPSELIGDAAIVADFARDTVSGRMEGFHGTVSGGRVTVFDGALDISKGVIDVTPEHDITAKVDGTLSGGSSTLVVDATLEGNFLGNPTFFDRTPPAVQLNANDRSNFTLNGNAVAGGMEVIGLR